MEVRCKSSTHTQPLVLFHRTRRESWFSCCRMIFSLPYDGKDASAGSREGLNMDMAVTIFTALSVNWLLIFRRRESTYGIATRVRYSAVQIHVCRVLYRIFPSTEIFQTRLNPTTHFYRPLDARVDPSWFSEVPVTCSNRVAFFALKHSSLPGYPELLTGTRY